MKNSIKILALSLVPACGATLWHPADNALASASWDEFAFASPNAGDSGSQGSAQIVLGTIIRGSELTTKIIDSYNPFIGGFGGNPDTYYFHDGAATWTTSLDLSAAVSHVRVSYSLLGFGEDGPEVYPMVPGIKGAAVVGRGSYSSGEGTVFYTDLELAEKGPTIDASFGDVHFPGYPGSFRSVDGVQVEVFESAPVPEPSVVSLAGTLLVGLLISRRR